ncbi:MAG: hypothetical protein K1X29_05295 [Bdellovibrionales bacterium]|nr:hypothetical protein [Bdellovibrionales bacterium]
MQAAVKSANSYPQDKIDHLKSLEVQLKELWSQYVKRLDETGFDETARSLRDRYFNIYRSYRHNKKWREVMNN